MMHTARGKQKRRARRRGEQEFSNTVSSSSPPTTATLNTDQSATPLAIHGQVRRSMKRRLRSGIDVPMRSDGAKPPVSRTRIATDHASEASGGSLLSSSPSSPVLSGNSGYVLARDKGRRDKLKLTRSRAQSGSLSNRPDRVRATGKHHRSMPLPVVPPWVIWGDSGSLVSPHLSVSVFDYFLSKDQRRLVLCDSLARCLTVIGGEDRVILFEALSARATDVTTSPTATLHLAATMPMHVIQRLWDKQAIVGIFDAMILEAARNTSYGMELLPHLLQRRSVVHTEKVVLDIIRQCLRDIRADIRHEAYYQKILGLVLDLYPHLHLPRRVMKAFLSAGTELSGKASESLHRLISRAWKHRDNTVSPEDMFASAIVANNRLQRANAALVSRFATITLRDRLACDVILQSVLAPLDVREYVVESRPRIELSEGWLIEIMETMLVPEAFKILPSIAPHLQLTQLSLECAARRVPPEYFEQLLSRSDLEINENILRSALCNFSSKLFRAVMHKAPTLPITEAILKDIILQLSSEDLQLGLERIAILRLSESLLLAAVRSYCESEIEQKLCVLREYASEKLSNVSERFYVAAIAYNPDRVSEIITVLVDDFDFEPTEGIILAALGTNDPTKLIKLLSDKAPGFKPTERLLWAMLPIDLAWRDYYETWENFEAAFDQILDLAEDFDISASLIAASFSSPHATRRLLGRHSNPCSLVITASDLEHWISKSAQVVGAEFNALEVCQDYGCKIEITETSVECIIRHCTKRTMKMLLADVNAAALVAQDDRFIVASVTARSKHMLSLLLNYYTGRISPTLTDLLLDNSEHLHYRWPDWQGLLKVLIKRIEDPYHAIEKLSKSGLHEEAISLVDRLHTNVIDSAKLQGAVARIVEHSWHAWGEADATALIDLLEKLPSCDLGPHFFCGLLSKQPYNSDTTPEAWEYLLSTNRITVQWTQDAQEIILRHQSARVIQLLMTFWHDHVQINERSIMAALQNEQAFFILQLLWQADPEVQVTSRCVEAALSNHALDCLDFLMLKKGMHYLAEEMFLLCLQQANCRTDSDSAELLRKMISLLLEHNPEFSVNEETVKRVLSDANKDIAALVLRHANASAFPVEAPCLMLERKWSARYTQSVLENHGIREIATDPVFLARILRTGTEGLEFLQLMGIENSTLARTVPLELLSDLFVGKAGRERMRSMAFYIQIVTTFDNLPITEEILVNDWLIDPDHAHGSSGYRTSAVARLLLERANDVTYGASTFRAICREYSHHCHNSIYKSELQGLWNSFPPRPVHVDKGAIRAVKEFKGCRPVLDVILGPEYETILHEDAIEECARQGEVIWFFRLLERARSEEVGIRDPSKLREAAYEGRVPPIIRACEEL